MSSCNGFHMKFFRRF